MRSALLALAFVAACSSGGTADRDPTAPNPTAPSPSTSLSPTTSTSTSTTAATTPTTVTTTVTSNSTTTNSTTVDSTTGNSTTTQSTTAVPTSSTTEPIGPRRITMAFAGDTLPHSPLWRRAQRNADGEGYDFDPMLAGLRPILRDVDLAVCHLETPIAPFGEEFTTSPRYGVPVEIVDAIAAAGFHRCSTASNHAADRGTAGVDRTVDALEVAGIGQSGMARTPIEIEPAVIDVAGVAVSHLSYTFSYNGLQFPDGEEWRSATIDVDRILADAATARAAGAEVVVVSMHWGAEGVHDPTSGQRRIADEITAGGSIDLVVGHHAHVVQPIELVNDTWVVYGLGNILSNLPTTARWPAASQDAMVVTIDIEVADDGVVTVATPVAIPTWVDQDAGWIVTVVDRALARDDLGAGRRALLERSLARTAAVVGDHLRPPLT